MASTALLRSIRRRDVASSSPLSAYRCLSIFVTDKLLENPFETLTGNAKSSWAFSSPAQSWVSLSRPFSSNDVSSTDLGVPSSCIAALEEKVTRNCVGAFTSASAVLSGASAKRQGTVVNTTNPLFQSTRFIGTRPQKEMKMLPNRFFRPPVGNLLVETNGQQLSAFSTDASASPQNVGEVNAKVLRPLSPHLPIYKPQPSSTSSIFNRFSGAYLSALVIAFYLLLVKMGSVCFTFAPFYLLVFYSAKVTLLSIEVAALAMAYHVYKSLQHLVK